MTFLTLLLVLFIDRVLWNADHLRHHHWFDRYRQRMQDLPILSQTLQHPWGAVLLVALPTALVGWLQVNLLPALGPLFEMAFAGLVLLLSLGPQELGRSVDRYLDAHAAGDTDETQLLAREFDDPGSRGRGSDGERVARGILEAACRRLIGPLFWFVAFGAAGATAYRLAHQLRLRLTQRQETTGPLGSGAVALTGVLDWVPIRITATGYAVAGNFDAVAAAWKRCSQTQTECDNDIGLLGATGEAALEQPGPRNEIALIEDSLALVWRNLTLWVVFVGSVTLFSL